MLCLVEKLIAQNRTWDSKLTRNFKHELSHRKAIKPIWKSSNPHIYHASQTLKQNPGGTNNEETVRNRSSSQKWRIEVRKIHKSRIQILRSESRTVNRIAKLSNSTQKPEKPKKALTWPQLMSWLGGEAREINPSRSRGIGRNGDSERLKP